MRKVLKALPDAVRKQVRQAILGGAEEMADTMRRLAPVDKGELRDSIVVTPGDEDEALYNKVRARRVEKDPYLAAIIHSDLFYAPFEEFGTAPHINEGERPGTQNPGVKAQPFFFPGYRSRKKAVIAKINRAARQGIKNGLK